MKKLQLIIMVPAIAAIVGLSASSSYANTYDFTYVFTGTSLLGNPGDTVTGVLEGTSAGGLVKITGAESLTIDGTTVTGPLYVGSYSVGSGGATTLDSGAVASKTDPTLNNFVIADSDVASILSSGANNAFAMLPSDQDFLSGFGDTGALAIANLPGGQVDIDATSVSWDPSLGGFGTWNITCVPDGGMTVVLLGGALIGLVALRRKLFCQEHRLALAK